MSMFRYFKYVFGGVGRWIQETYCSVGQRVAERLESVSDRVAENRYRAEHASPIPTHPVIEIKNYGIINGHKHTS
jgi:hypothetical protein